MDDYNNMNNPYGSPEPPAQPDYASQYNQDQYSQQPDYANQYNQQPDYNAQYNQQPDYNAQYNQQPQAPDYSAQYDQYNQANNAYGQQPYQAQPTGGFNQAPDPGETLSGPAKVFSIVSLVCGIISMIPCCWTCFITGIPAIVFAILAKKKYSGKNIMALLGLIFGIVGLVLAVVLSVISICSMIVRGTSSSSYYYY